MINTITNKHNVLPKLTVFNTSTPIFMHKSLKVKSQYHNTTQYTMLFFLSITGIANFQYHRTTLLLKNKKLKTEGSPCAVY